MAQPTRPVTELIDFSGGLNRSEPPDQIGPNQVADMRNLEYRRTRGLKRRRGSTENLTNASGVFAAGSTVVSMFRHTPGQSETSMELWGISDDTTPELGRVAAGAAWAAVSLTDAISAAADAWLMKGVSFNGKLYLPYNSAVDRLHVWDGTAVFRAGLATPAAPTVADTGAGAYAAVARYYKVQWVRIYASGATVYSPLSAASTVFTPSGAGTAARVTQPTVASEGETNWFLWGSADGVNYYVLAGIAIGTTTYDDSTAPSAYATAQPTRSGFPSAADYYTAPISAKYLLVDGAQLLLAGSHETTSLSSTVYFTPALKTSGFDVDDDERVPSTNRIDVDPQLGGGITGIGGPIGGTPVVFKIERTYLLNPTGDVTLPYTRQLLSDSVGCISHQGIVMAEDEHGAPALYFPSRRGYYRYGTNGLEYCGADIEDLWANVGLSEAVGVSAAYHRDAGQIWIYAPISSQLGGGSYLMKFHVARARRSEDGVRGGWTLDDGNVALCASVCMFSASPAATMGLRLKPYIGPTDGRTVYKADHDSSNRDDNDATAYTAYVVTRCVERGMGEEFGIQNVLIQGVGDSAVTLDVSLRADFAASDSVTAIPVALATTRGQVVVPGLEISECDVVQVRVADQSALNQHWSLDRIGLRYRPESPKGT
jgi:hypothetical protein